MISLRVVVVSLFALSAFGAPTPELVDIEARQACPNVQVYFARGTNETPTIGTTVGPPFSTALSKALTGKSVTFTGISYPATIAGYLAGGDAGGGKTMADAVTAIASRCPSTKIVISGYSQGAQVTHIAAGRLSATVQNRIVAVVTFGDPFRDRALPGVLQSRRKTFCNSDDLICDGLPIVVDAHTTYGSDAPAAAAYVAARV